jgi:hypothetical protein
MRKIDFFIFYNAMENFITLLVDDKTFVVNEGCITDKPESYLAGLIKFDREKNKNNTIRLNMFPEEFQILLEYHRNDRPFKPINMTYEKYKYILNKYAVDEGPDIIYYNDCYDKKYSIDVNEFFEKIAIILIDFKDPYRRKTLTDKEIEDSNWIFTFGINKNWHRKDRYFITNGENRKTIYKKMMWFFGEQRQFYHNAHFILKNNEKGELYLRHTIVNIKSIPIDKPIHIKDEMPTTGIFDNMLIIDSKNIIYSYLSIDKLSSLLKMDKSMFTIDEEEDEEDDEN